MAYKNLSHYEVGNTRMEISDSLIGRLNESFLTVDIKLKRNENIPKQSFQAVQTNLIINGPIKNFNMYVKKHSHLPVMGVLRTQGFISPQERSMLKVEVQNPYNYDLR